MEITFAGSIIIPLVVLISILEIKYILPLAIILHIFQGVSVLNIHGSNYYSLSVYHFILIFITFHFFIRRKFFLKNFIYNKFLKILYIFLIWSIIITIVGPLVFDGVGVYNPRIGMDDQYNNLSNLSFSAGNLSQLFYILMNISFLAFGIIHASLFSKKLIIKSYIYSGIIVVLFSFWQKISFIYNIYYPAEILYSNISLEQVREFNIRLSSTFSEPSLLNGFMVPFLFFIYKYEDINRYKKYIIIISILTILIWSESSTGVLSIILMSALIYFIKQKNYVINIKFLFKFAVFILSLFIISYEYNDFFVKTILDKGDTLSAVYRFAADEHSIILLINTFGIGVGLGSNRPSSFITLLLSTLGILGIILISCLIYMQLKLSLNLLIKKYKLIPFIYLFISTLFPMFIGIPDVDFQVLWVNWMILAFITCVSYHNIKNLNGRVINEDRI